MRFYDNIEHIDEGPLFTFIATNQKNFPNNHFGQDITPYHNYIAGKSPKNDPSMGKTTEFNYPPEFPHLIHSIQGRDNTGVVYWDHVHLKLSEAYNYVKQVEAWIPTEIQRRLDNYILEYNFNVDKNYEETLANWEAGGKIGPTPVKPPYWHWDTRGLRSQFFNEIRNELSIPAISPYGYSLWAWSSV